MGKLSNLHSIIILMLTGIIGVSCSNKKEDAISDPHNEQVQKDIIVATIPLSSKQKKPIDSLKMHAIDNLYFGLNPGKTDREIKIDNMPYLVTLSKAEPGKGVFYYMLKSKGKITTIKRAKSVLNDLKKTITRKYKKFIVLNQTYNTKHPEDRKIRQSSFEDRAEGEYDRKIMGQPYEFAAYKWNLNYKTIQIGYFINNKNSEVYMQNSPATHEYIIYIELNSKIIKPKQVKDVSNNDDSNKF
ncbi:hypothetical protein IWX84_002563 [Flavobacterium sp. CG_9.10]|uniref:hypothetical protein n=1 Tax=Flavobacterium sp. CG_9.10 TaxID=2787729 RepID=UPI0018CBB15C|nr:hypothetical protein [Flavobacterium sp. CG_9.10]MBG6111676.1 hypothetical protein [Flavobacterium sp. CG_9.10]